MYMYEREYMFLQGQSKIIREGDWGTLASALIFSAKPLTDNNVEVKSLERGGGKIFLLLVTLGSV